MFGLLPLSLASVPSSEAINGPTAALGGVGVVFAVLAELTRAGVMKPSILVNIAIFFYVLISTQEILMPTPTLEAFGFAEISPLFKFLMGSYATVKVRVSQPAPQGLWRSATLTMRGAPCVCSFKSAPLCSSAR